jgi:murein L,D-transpeptidase YcbB/YkuD
LATPAAVRNDLCRRDDEPTGGRAELFCGDGVGLSKLRDVDDRRTFDVMRVHGDEMIVIDLHTHLATFGQPNRLLVLAARWFTDVHAPEMLISVLALRAKTKIYQISHGPLPVSEIHRPAVRPIKRSAPAARVYGCGPHAKLLRWFLLCIGYIPDFLCSWGRSAKERISNRDSIRWHALRSALNTKLSRLTRAFTAVFVASASLCLSPPVRAAAPTPDAETQIVARYLEQGGRVPDWARSRAFLATLADEAEAHGLSWSGIAALAEGALTEGQTLAATLRLGHMLATGAVAPNSVQRDWTIPVPTFAPDAALQLLLASDDPLSWLHGLAPHDPAYRGLQVSLSKYRAMAKSGGWPSLSPGPTLALGMAGERVSRLRERLKIEGDFVGDASDTSSFDAATQQAVRSFQVRHGLPADGRVGHETFAALNVGVEQRYRQIAANMERWRWLPRKLPAKRIMINAAAARLELFEADSTVLQLRTIVGKPRTPTPVLSATIDSLLFNPPWDIPIKIAANELKPLARRDPAYFEREGIVAVGNGERLRQLPGPKNALGQIKFEMPNPLDVYLHDTPNRELFQRQHRFFSHGCIRVERPRLLAQHLLPSWPTEAIDNAISSRATRRVAVDPLAVFVVYFTVIANPDSTEFLEDTYHRDPRLIDALFSHMTEAIAQKTDLVTECSNTN